MIVIFNNIKEKRKKETKGQKTKRIKKNKREEKRNMANTAPVISKKVELPKFSPEDIPSIIGPSAKVCEGKPHMKKFPSLKKNVVTPAWRSFKTYQESLEDDHENKGKNPGKIFVKLGRGMNKDKNEVVLATIECESDEMFKFIMLHLNKYQDSFKRPQRKMFYNIYATFPQHLIPILIGSGGAGVRELKNSATEFMDDSFTEEDLEKCQKSFLKIDTFEPRDQGDFLDNVDGERSSFIGEHPSEEEKMIKMSVSSFAGKESFQNFAECLCDVVKEKLEEIVTRDQAREDRRNRDKEGDLAECMEALEQEW